MKQTKHGDERTKEIRKELAKNCKAGEPYKTESNEIRTLEHWKIGQTEFLLSIYTNGYNLYQSTTGPSDIADDILAINRMAVDIWKGEKE